MRTKRVNPLRDDGSLVPLSPGCALFARWTGTRQTQIWRFALLCEDRLSKRRLVTSDPVMVGFVMVRGLFGGWIVRFFVVPSIWKSVSNGNWEDQKLKNSFNFYGIFFSSLSILFYNSTQSLTFHNQISICLQLVTIFFQRHFENQRCAMDYGNNSHKSSPFFPQFVLLN